MATEIKPPIKYDMVWTMYGKRADFFGIAERFHIDPVTARVIRNRDMITDEEIDTYLNGGLDRLHDPVMMKNMEKGCSLMLEEIRSRNRIRIISDYDVDGVSSNYILYKGLQRVCGSMKMVRLQETGSIMIFRTGSMMDMESISVW